MTIIKNLDIPISSCVENQIAKFNYINKRTAGGRKKKVES